MVAGRIGCVAGGGRAFRYGGEEFTVVFPGKKVGDVAIHLEKVRMAVESAGFSLRDQGRPMIEYGGRKRRGGPRRSESEKIGVTISIGAATNSARTTDPAQVIKKADMALYKAKNGGRNRVVF
jgi:GGDEF domain-containing protein